MLNTFQVPHKKVVEGQHSKIFFLKAFWLWLAVGQIVFQCSLLKKMNTKLAIIWKLDLSKKRGYPRLARFQQNVLQTFFFSTPFIFLSFSMQYAHHLSSYCTVFRYSICNRKLCWWKCTEKKKKSMIIALYKEMKATSPKSFKRADLNNL